jgi:nicotinamidase-related amidase
MAEPVMLLDMAERFAPQHSALVLIDLQKDFCSDGFGADRAGRDLDAAKAVVPVAASLLAAARKAGVIVAHVGFWTLPDHGSDSGPWLAQRRRSTASADNLCIAGSEGAEFVEALTPLDGELVVHKHRYSAFSGTNLDMLLRARAVKSLVIAGVSTNACVESSFRAGFELDYYICVPPEAVGSWNQQLHGASLANVDHRFGVTLAATDIENIWKKSGTGSES